MNSLKRKKRISPIHPASAILLTAGLLGFAVHIFCIFSPAFADFINNGAGHALRFILSKIFSVFPFSFMEFLLYASPLIIAVTAFFTLKCAQAGNVGILRAVSAVISIAAGVYFCFAVGFAPGYRGSSIADKMGLERQDVTAKELYTVTLTVTSELNVLCEKINYSSDGSSQYPYSLDDLCEKICGGYLTLSEEYDSIKTFSSEVKPLIISPLMTYTHISGIYSFFTGEANLNTNYPDFINVYTAAHEMAHQRGISREDEANFVAYLVCLNTDDDYIKYCAYLNMYEYLSNALYSADKALWKDAKSTLHEKARGELFAYSVFFDEYRDSTAGEISDTLNNAYLESQGTEGTKSYGMVVDLTVAYYLH